MTIFNEGVRRAKEKTVAEYDAISVECVVIGIYFSRLYDIG